MWFGCFLMCAWKRGCFAAQSGFLVASFRTAVVGQVCKTAVGLHLWVALSSCCVDWSSLGLAENVRALQKVSLNFSQKKGYFLPKWPKVTQTNTGLFIHLTVTICFCKDSELLGRGDPRKEKWRRTQALGVMGQCRAPEGGKLFSSSLWHFINQLFCFSLVLTLPHPPTDSMKH